jgi:hypothetical protein
MASIIIINRLSDCWRKFEDFKGCLVQNGGRSHRPFVVKPLYIFHTKNSFIKS